MRVLFTGGTGYLGRHLVARFRTAGHDCTVITRGDHAPWDDPAVALVRADPKHGGPWQDAVAAADVVVNLAGAPLIEPPKRWSDDRKRVLRASRIATTERVTEAIARADAPPACLVSASAVGYYGDRGEEILDETAAPGDDFLAHLCVDWEAAATEVADQTRVVVLRTAPVLGPGAPLLGPMLPAFKLGLGGPWGSGRQWWPWIHIEDVVELVLLAVDRHLAGPLNLTAPQPVRVETFAKSLGAVLGRPAVARVPAFALKLALGEAAEALLVSQRVVPARAEEAGYAFRYPTVRAALEASIGR